MQESQYARSLIEASRDPLVTISIEGKIMDMNQAMMNMTGLSREELTGSDFMEYFTDSFKARAVYKEVFASGFVKDYPLTMKDHHLTDVLFNGSVYMDGKGQTLGAVVVARDITEQRRIESELTEARDFAELATGIAEVAQGKAEDATRIAEDAVKAKQQFLSNMSHEIRTPMNAIIGLTELLLEEKFEGTNLENIKSIKYSADNLLVIINDILDFSKIEAGKVTFESIDFDIRHRMNELKKTFEHRTKEKSLGFEILVQPEVPNSIKGDPYRLNQILFNLVGNAIKFTSEGNIKVTVNIFEQSENKIWIQFVVKDSGIGIPLSQQSKIFESFTQANTDTTRKYGGTGLGLAITKNLVQLQDGTIGIESEVGIGTSFIVKLPYGIGVNEHQEDVGQKRAEPSDLSGLNILLVEDNLMNQFVAKPFSYEQIEKVLQIVIEQTEKDLEKVA